MSGDGGAGRERPYGGDSISVIRHRLAQHRQNLALWQSGALDMTVDDDDEKQEIMAQLRTAIAELEEVLKQLGGRPDVGPSETK